MFRENDRGKGPPENDWDPFSFTLDDSMEAPERTPLEDLVPFTEANWGSLHVSLRECTVYMYGNQDGFVLGKIAQASV